MKKLSVFATLAVVSFFAIASPAVYAQAPEIPIQRQAQSYYYMELSEVTLGLLKSAISVRKSININFGKEAPTATYYKITDEKETGLVQFENVIGALNYLGAQGWEVVSTYKRDTGNSGVVFFLLRLDASKHDATAITRAIDEMLAGLKLQPLE